MDSKTLEMLKEIPGYQGILKAFLKELIQKLLDQLHEYTEEESVLLWTGSTLTTVGSQIGRSFLNKRQDIQADFFMFCLQESSRRREPARVARQDEDSDVTMCESDSINPHLTNVPVDDNYQVTTVNSSRIRKKNAFVAGLRGLKILNCERLMRMLKSAENIGGKIVNSASQEAVKEGKEKKTVGNIQDVENQTDVIALDEDLSTPRLKGDKIGRLDNESETLSNVNQNHVKEQKENIISFDDKIDVEACLETTIKATETISEKVQLKSSVEQTSNTMQRNDYSPQTTNTAQTKHCLEQTVQAVQMVDNSKQTTNSAVTAHAEGCLDQTTKPAQMKYSSEQTTNIAEMEVSVDMFKQSRSKPDPSEFLVGRRVRDFSSTHEKELEFKASDKQEQKRLQMMAKRSSDTSKIRETVTKKSFHPSKRQRVAVSEEQEVGIKELGAQTVDTPLSSHEIQGQTRIIAENKFNVKVQRLSCDLLPKILVHKLKIPPDTSNSFKVKAGEQGYWFEGQQIESGTDDENRENGGNSVCVDKSDVNKSVNKMKGNCSDCQVRMHRLIMHSSDNYEMQLTSLKHSAAVQRSQKSYHKVNDIIVKLVDDNLYEGGKGTVSVNEIKLHNRVDSDCLDLNDKVDIDCHDLNDTVDNEMEYSLNMKEEWIDPDNPNEFGTNHNHFRQDNDLSSSKDSNVYSLNNSLDNEMEATTDIKEEPVETDSQNDFGTSPNQSHYNSSKDSYLHRFNNSLHNQMEVSADLKRKPVDTGIRNQVDTNIEDVQHEKLEHNQLVGPFQMYNIPCSSERTEYLRPVSSHVKEEPSDMNTDTILSSDVQISPQIYRTSKKYLSNLEQRDKHSIMMPVVKQEPSDKTETVLTSISSQSDHTSDNRLINNVEQRDIVTSGGMPEPNEIKTETLMSSSSQTVPQMDQYSSNRQIDNLEERDKMTSGVELEPNDKLKMISKSKTFIEKTHPMLTRSLAGSLEKQTLTSTGPKLEAMAALVTTVGKTSELCSDSQYQEMTESSDAIVSDGNSETNVAMNSQPQPVITGLIRHRPYSNSNVIANFGPASDLDTHPPAPEVVPTCTSRPHTIPITSTWTSQPTLCKAVSTTTPPTSLPKAALQTLSSCVTFQHLPLVTDALKPQISPPKPVLVTLASCKAKSASKPQTKSQKPVLVTMASCKAPSTATTVLLPDINALTLNGKMFQFNQSGSSGRSSSAPETGSCSMSTGSQRQTSQLGSTISQLDTAEETKTSKMSMACSETTGEKNKNKRMKMVSILP